MSDTISILGCGWLGLPLADFLIENGYRVKGSTTSPEKLPFLAQRKIQPFLLNFKEEKEILTDEQLDFFNCDLLIINIPPKVRSVGNDQHPAQIRNIIDYIEEAAIKKVIYISATSVYPRKEEVVDEDTLITYQSTGNKALLEAEKLLEECSSFKKNVLRCGGLLGYERIPGRYYSGKTLDTGHTPVNYIHRDDVVEMIALMIKKNIWNKTYNLVTPSHPTREEVFLKNARDFNFDPPYFIPPVEKKDYKLVLGEKLMRELQYEFLYPDPRFFYYTP